MSDMFKTLTCEQLLKRIDEADMVYVVTEISKGNPVRIYVDPDDLKDVIEAEGFSLGNELIVQEEDVFLSCTEETKTGFNLIVGRVCD